MSDYQIDCATKAEWAARAFAAEARIEELEAKLTKEVEKNFPPMYLHPTVAEECIDDLHDKVSELKRDKQELEAKLAKAVNTLEKQENACPFCGGVGSMYRDHCHDGSGIFYAIKCNSCGAKSQEKYASKGNDCPLLYQEVWNAWNTRAELKGDSDVDHNTF